MGRSQHLHASHSRRNKHTVAQKCVCLRCGKCVCRRCNLILLDRTQAKKKDERNYIYIQICIQLVPVDGHFSRVAQKYANLRLHYGDYFKLLEMKHAQIIA